MMKNLLVILFLFFTFLGFSQNHAFDMNAKLGKGINLGNCFEAPNLGEWGVVVKESFIVDIQAKGFDHIRIPARWSAHVSASAPYTIDADFMDTVKTTVDLALAHGLYVVLDVHHFEEMFVDPIANYPILESIWEQLSLEFEGYTDSLYFEIMNEPHDDYTPTIWNTHLSQLLDVIRIKHPTRMVIIGTAEYGGIGGLSKLEIPATDTNLIVTVHYYNPFDFTHQGANWTDQIETGISWDSTASQINAVTYDLNSIQTYSETHNVPIYMGEFGVIQEADEESRARWAGHLRARFAEYGFSWAYWEYASGFGIYDASIDCYYTQLLQALTDSTDECDCILADTLIVKNTTFTNMLSPWSSYGQQGASGELTLVNEEARLEVFQKGSEFWHLQVTHSNIPLVYGTRYRFEFDAYASQIQNVLASVGASGGDYHTYITIDTAFTTDKSQYSIEFTFEEPSSNNNRIVFECGLVDAQYVYFDNINLIVLEAGVPVETITITTDNPDGFTITEKGGSIQLYADVEPLNVSSSQVTWKITQGSGIASISQDGILTARANSNGIVGVQATAFDGSGVIATKQIIISNQVSLDDIAQMKVQINNNVYIISGHQIYSVEVFSILGIKQSFLYESDDTKITIQNIEPLNIVRIATDTGIEVIKVFE